MKIAGLKPGEEVDFSFQIDPKIKTLTWEEFKAFAEPYGAAIDGYVPGGSKKNKQIPLISDDHHLIYRPGREEEQDADRLTMRAACAQLMMQIRTGLFRTFRDSNGPRIKGYFKKPNEDDCLCYSLMKNPLLLFKDDGRLEALIDLADKVDTTVGTYVPTGDLKLYKNLNWVTDPYREFRLSGGIERYDAKEYADIMESVYQRLLKFIADDGKIHQLDPDMNYEPLGGGPGWIMIKEIGPQGRAGATQDGYEAIVTVRELPGNKYGYVLYRHSDCISYFDLPFFRERFNQYEAQCGNTTHLWGGAGDVVIGSPQGRGTDMNPQTFSLMLNDMIAERNPREIIDSLQIPSSRRIILPNRPNDLQISI